MPQASAKIVKIPTEIPQPAPGRPSAGPKSGHQSARLRLISGGGARPSARGADGEVIRLDCGITVYPARADTSRWRATWYENGRRKQCEAASEEKLSVKLEKVRLRLESGEPPSEIPTESPQSQRRVKPEVITLEHGISVYPARSAGGRWRAVWYEDDCRKQCEAASEEKLTAKLEKVKIRLEADAPNMTKPGVDLIAHFLDPNRLPVEKRWSRKHAHTQARLCARYVAPVIAAVDCQDIKASHMQKVVNAAPTASEGDRVRRMISALVTAGIDAGYLVNSRLAKVHWQAGDRQLPAPEVSVAGESGQWVDPAEIPSADDVAGLGRALAEGLHGDRDELMANTAAYTGLRWGELVALTVQQVTRTARTITVDRKVVEIAGRLFAEAPKNRKYRRTIYPNRTPGGYPLAERFAARIEAVRAEQMAGTNPLGLIFPSPEGKYLRSSNFNRKVLKRAYLTAGWRDAYSKGAWTWHSLRHVFCTTALFTWKLDPTDVARMAGHASYRITLDMYVGSTAGVLERARTATE